MIHIHQRIMKKVNHGVNKNVKQHIDFQNG